MKKRIRLSRSIIFVSILFILINIVSRSSLLFLKTFEEIDAITIIDDSYISWAIAKNIAEGKGPLYSVSYTNGFQPLYVFLCAPFFAIFDSKITPLYFSLGLLIAFDCLCLLMLIKIVNFFTGNILSVILISFFWVSSPYVTSITLAGLETIISFFFILTVFYYYFKHNGNFNANTGSRNLVILGILCGLAVFARVDNAFLAAIMFVFIFTELMKNKEKNNPAMILKSLLMFSVMVVLTLLPWLLYSFYYTGDLIQQSGEAVRYQNIAFYDYFSFLSPFHVHIIEFGLKVVFVKNFSIWFLIAVFCILLLLKFKNVDRSFLKEKMGLLLPLFIFCSVIFLSYILHIFGMWYFKRYFFPVLFLSIILLAVVFTTVLKTYSAEKNKSIGKIFLTASVAVLILIHVTRHDFKVLYLDHNPEHGYMAIGKWVSEYFEDGTVIGSSQTGSLYYFADNLKVINLDGVVNKKALKYAKEKRLIEYIKKENIEYVINWDINHEYLLSNSENLKENDLIKLFVIEDFKTYLWNWTVYKINYD